MVEISDYVQPKIPEFTQRRTIDSDEMIARAESLGATHLLKQASRISVMRPAGTYGDESLLDDVFVRDLERFIKRGGRFKARAVELLENANSYNGRQEHLLDKGTHVGVNTMNEKKLFIKIPKKKQVHANNVATQNGSHPPIDEDEFPF